MSVGIVLITHDDVGGALLRTATSALGMCPLQVEVLAVRRTDAPEAMIAEARRLVARVSQGDGVLVMTDMYGSTPSNIATAMLGPVDIKSVAGLNLPMLIKVFNYPQSTLEVLFNKALDGGRGGIIACESA